MNLSLLEAKVDSAVASQSAPAIAGATEAAGGPSSQAQAAPHTVEAPPSTAPSTSDGMEEIDVVAADVLHGGKVSGEPLANLRPSSGGHMKVWRANQISVGASNDSEG